MEKVRVYNIRVTFASGGRHSEPDCEYASVLWSLAARVRIYCNALISRFFIPHVYGSLWR